MEFSPEIRGGRDSNLRECLKICSKTKFFGVFWIISRVKEGIWCQNGKMGGVLTIQGQTADIPRQSPGKLSIFPVLSLFSICPSLKSGKPTPIKGQIYYYFTKFRGLKLKIMDSGSI